jgi:hypothetical protein
MQLQDLIDKAASNQPLSRGDLESVARGMGMPMPEVMDVFARQVALGYLRGQYSFGFADMAMSQLFGVAALETGGMSEFGRQIFGAFDAGEYIQDNLSPEEQGEALTRTLLGKIAALSDDGVDRATG